jgi:hypothetical protein
MQLDSPQLQFFEGPILPRLLPLPNPSGKKPLSRSDGAIGEAATVDCLHANRLAPPPNPHAPSQLFVSRSTNRMPRVRNSWGRGGARSHGSPRPKPLTPCDIKFFGGLKIIPLIRSSPGRAGGVGPDMTSRTVRRKGPLHYRNATILSHSNGDSVAGHPVLLKPPHGNSE